MVSVGKREREDEQEDGQTINRGREDGQTAKIEGKEDSQTNRHKGS